MPLSERQIVNLEQFIELTVTQAEGNERDIINYLSSIREPRMKFNYTYAVMMELSLIQEAFTSPHKICGASILDIDGGFSENRPLNDSDHNEAIAILNKSIDHVIEKIHSKEITFDLPKNDNISNECHGTNQPLHVNVENSSSDGETTYSGMSAHASFFNRRQSTPTPQRSSRSLLSRQDDDNGHTRNRTNTPLHNNYTQLLTRLRYDYIINRTVNREDFSTQQTINSHLAL